MVYFERSKELRNVKRKDCCKILPQDEKTIETIVNERKKLITEKTARDTRSTKKYEAERLLKVEKKLNLKRKEADAKRDDLVSQWNEIKRNEEEFHDVFVQFHQFIIDNAEKIEREQAKINQTRHDKAAKEEEIKVMNERIINFRNIFDQMKQQLEKHAFYEDFMTQYITSSGTKNIRDVLFRFELLLESREYVEQTMNKRHHLIWQYTKDYNNILQNWTGELLRFGEQLTQQWKKLEDAQRQVIYWEKTINDIKRHAHSLWIDMELTQEALDHVICLLLIRIRARLGTSFFKNNTRFLYLLSTTEGKIMYLNKMLGDLGRVKDDVHEILKEENYGTKIEVATSMTSPPKKRVTLRKRKRPVQYGYPELSPATAHIIDLLESNIRRDAERPRRRSRWQKSELTPLSSQDTSTTESLGSFDSRPRAMTSWFITREARSKKKRGALQPMVLDATPEVGHAKASIASSRYSVPWSLRTGYIPPLIRYSCVSLTTDASTTLLDEKRTERQDRIIQRNFDRYEKSVYNKMDTDSSLIKINKKTGKLELPKLKFKRKEPTERPSMAVILPKIEPHAHKKYKKRIPEDSSEKTGSTQNQSLKSSIKTKKDNLLLEDVTKVLNRPTITQQYTFGNLS